MKRLLFNTFFIYLSHAKTIKYVDQERQDNFSCKRENTLKSMEFSEGDEQLCLLTVRNIFLSDELNIICLKLKRISVIVGLPGKGLVGALPISQAGTGMTSRVKGQSKVSLEECLVLTQELS